MVVGHPQGALVIIRVSLFSVAIYRRACVTVWGTVPPRPYLLGLMPCLSCGGIAAQEGAQGWGVGLTAPFGGQLH